MFAAYFIFRFYEGLGSWHQEGCTSIAVVTPMPTLFMSICIIVVIQTFSKIYKLRNYVGVPLLLL